MTLAQAANELRAGNIVEFRAYGHSMEPRIRHGETVYIEPLNWSERKPKRGQIVLARVGKRWYLHLVSGVRLHQVQISNNKGHVNGWTFFQNVVGIVKEKS